MENLIEAFTTVNRYRIIGEHTEIERKKEEQTIERQKWRVLRVVSVNIHRKN